MVGVPHDSNLSCKYYEKLILIRNIVSQINHVCFIASAWYLAPRQACIQSQPSSHFVSVNQTSELLVRGSACSPASEQWQCCDYFPCSFISNAWSFYCHRSNTNHKRCQRSSVCVCSSVQACVCWLMMNPSCLNSTPLTCHSATEVMLITQPNTIAKPSSSVCVWYDS